MTTFVSANTFAYSVTHITDKMLNSLKFIIRESGLSPAKLTRDWEVLDRGIRTWLAARDLEAVYLEVFDPSGILVNRWDFDIVYDYSSDGDGGMWVDTDAIRYSIIKAGYWPSQCDYRIVTDTKPGRANVAGWSSTTLRSTEGFTRHSIGSTIGAPGAGTSTAYWRKA